MKNIAIVLAGGVGSRIAADIPKQFVEVLGKPIMIYTLETFQNHPLIDEIILVCIRSHIDLARKYCTEYRLTKVKSVVEGGADFVHSCMKGMNILRGTCEKSDVVVIASADRPFITGDEIEDSITVCRKHGSGISARPCSLCMCRVDENNKTHASEYLRESLVQTSTPWAFIYQDLLLAFDKYESGELPDCESYPIAIYLAAGKELYFSKAKPGNIKITEKHDIALMEYMILEQNKR